MRLQAFWALALGGLAAITSTVSAGAAGEPAIVLKPIAPAGHPKEHIGTLFPRRVGEHLFTPNGTDINPEIATLFAEASITYQHPSVVLPHSDLVRFTHCLNNGIEIGFSNRKAYEYVKTHWSDFESEHFMIITESLHCNEADIGMHVYWLVSDLEFSDSLQTVIAVAQEVSVKNAYNDVRILSYGDSADDQVQLSWGSTNPHDDELGGGGANFEAHPHKESGSSFRPTGPPDGGLSRRAEAPLVVFQPWFANIPQVNGTKIQYSSASVTPQYFVTPIPGQVFSPSDRFTIITVAPNTGSNTTGYLVYGYGGQSVNQIQPNAYYAISSPSRPLAPGYNLYNVAAGSCPVRMISYIFKEPATFPSNVQAPSSRGNFNVTAYAQAAGLGLPLGSNLISVVNGGYPASCDVSSAGSSSARSSASSSKVSSSVFIDRISSSSVQIGSSSVKISSASAFKSSSAAVISSSAVRSSSAGGSSSAARPSASSSIVSASASSSKAPASSAKASSAGSSASSSKASSMQASSSKASSASASSVISKSASSVGGSSSSKAPAGSASSSVSKSASSVAGGSSSSKSAGSSFYSLPVSSSSRAGGPSSTSASAPGSSSKASGSASSASSASSARVSGGSSSVGSVSASGGSSSASSTVSSITGPIPTNDACSSPPDTFQGVVAAACGPGFDAAKDARLGFFDFENEGDQNQFLAASFSPRGFLSGRGFFSNLWKKIKNGVESAWNAVQKELENIKKAVEEIYQQSVREVQKVVDIIEDTLTKPIEAPFAQDFAVSIYPGKKVDSPWGTKDSVLVWSSNKAIDDGAEPNGLSADVTIFCKECGVSGKVVLGGNVAFTIWSIKAGVNVGILAEAAYTKSIKKKLITIVIPEAGVKIGDLLVVGLVLNVDAVLSINVKATGQALIGASVQIDGFNAVLDVRNGKVDTDGFNPVFNKGVAFQASGEISASVGLAMPVEFVLAIEVPPLDVDKVIGLRNTPQISASALLHVGTSGSVNSGTCANGFEYSVDLSNRLDFDFLDKIIPLFSIKKDGLSKGCFPIPGLPQDPEIPTLPEVSSSSSRRTSSTRASVSTSRTSSKMSSTSSSASRPSSSSSVVVVPSSVSASASSSSVVVVSSSASAPASPTSSSASAPVSTGVYAIASDSPFKFGTEYAQFKATYAYVKEVGTTPLALSSKSGCLKQCEDLAGCLGIVWYTLAPDNGYTGPERQCMGLVADSPSKIGLNLDGVEWLVIVRTSCSTLEPLLPGQMASCTRYFNSVDSPVADDSPQPSGTVEWASYEGVRTSNKPNTAAFFNSIEPVGMTTLQCATKCANDFNCNSSFMSAYSSQIVCFGNYGAFSNYDLAMEDGARLIVKMTCAQLTQLTAFRADACRRYFPGALEPEVGVPYETADDSPELEGDVEWASYTNAVAFNVKTGARGYNTLDMTVLECARTCERDSTATLRERNCQGSFSPASEITLQAATVGAPRTILRQKCADLEERYPLLIKSCRRYFPGDLRFDIFEGSPNDEGREWSYYGNGIMLARWEIDSRPGPTSLDSCIALCRAQDDKLCYAVRWVPSNNRCYFTDGNPSVDNLPFGRPSPEADQQMVVFKSCLSTSILRGEYGCKKYYPGNRQVFGLSPLSRLSAPPNSSYLEWASVPHYGIDTKDPKNMAEGWGLSIMFDVRNFNDCMTKARVVPDSYDGVVYTYDESKDGSINCYLLSQGGLNVYGAPFRGKLAVTRMYNRGGTVFLQPASEVIGNLTKPLADEQEVERLYWTLPTRVPGPLPTYKRDLAAAPARPTPSREILHHRFSSIGTKRQQVADGAQIGADIAAALDVSILGDQAVTGAVVNAQTVADQIPQDDFVVLRDPSGSFELAPQDNGNLLLTKSGSQLSYRFARTAEGSVVGDGSTASFVYDVQEMAAFGVARFRFKAFDSVARSSRAVSLTPINYDGSSNTPGVYVAIDLTGGVFYPVICSVAGGETKAFLVKDPATGIPKLQSPELQVVVTGGPTTSCALLALITTGNPGRG